MAAEAHEPEIEIDSLTGTEIAERYRVDSLVARGGMGSVYRGVHVELGRPVAIKILAATYARDEEAVKRFQREARTASRIDHPNIVGILDFGRLDTGEPYLVMELLEGEDLADAIAREAPMPPARVIELLGPIASALDAVHRERLLHRDIKPANVFLAKRADGTVVPKLLDFGLAALRETPDDDRLTREGIVVGTPHYVSPEAAEGLAVDERTDVYSLGLVAYEMLSGVLPIDGNRPMSLMYAKVRRPAPTLSQRTGKSFPPEIEQLIGRTLSRTPDKRPPTAGALLAELTELAKGLPADTTHVDLPQVEPDADGRPEHERPMRASEPLEVPIQSRTRWIVAALVALCMIAGGSGAWIAASDTRTPEARPDRIVAPAPPVVAPPAPVAVREPAPEPAPEAAPGPAAPSPTEPALAAAPSHDPRRRGRTHGSIPRMGSAPPREVRTAEPSAPSPPSEAGPDEARAAELTREAGTALLRGELPRARQLYRQATYADGSHAAAWRGLGLASERMGLTPEAVTAYRRYLRLAPGASDAGRVRARLAQLESEAP